MDEGSEEKRNILLKDITTNWNGVIRKKTECSRKLTPAREGNLIKVTFNFLSNEVTVEGLYEV